MLAPENESGEGAGGLLAVDLLEVPSPKFRVAGWMSPKGWAFRYHDFKGHFPCKIGSKIGGIDKRNRCMICNTKGTLGCSKCVVTLCFINDQGQNCFSRFHTMHDFNSIES